MNNKGIVLGAAALGSMLALTSCGMSFGLGLDQSDSMAYDVTDQVAVMVADTGAGDIVVNESDRKGVHVVETRHWRGGAPANGHRVDGQTLTLNYDCGACEIDYRVDVPRGTEVRLDSGAGTLTLRSLTGLVTVSTGAGDVDASGLTAKRVKAETGSGTIKLRFSAVPDHVDIESGAGDGLVWVPPGVYNVDTDTGAGDEEVQVTRDPAAPHTVIVKTGVGDAKVLKG